MTCFFHFLHKLATIQVILMPICKDLYSVGQIVDGCRKRPNSIMGFSIAIGQSCMKHEILETFRSFLVNHFVSELTIFLLSAFLWNFFLCRDQGSGDVPPTLGIALLCSSRGALIRGCIQI